MDIASFPCSVGERCRFPNRVFLKEIGLPSRVSPRSLGTPEQLELFRPQGTGGSLPMVPIPPGPCGVAFHPVTLQAAD